MKRILILAVAAAALACGSNNSSNAAVSHNSPGTGTNTLKVVGVITAANLPTVTTQQTTFSVTVTDGTGATVNGATVTIANASVPNGSVTLTQAAAGTPYTATVSSYPSGDFRLDVVNGADGVHNVVVGGVGMHTINSPAQNGTVPANQPPFELRPSKPRADSISAGGISSGAANDARSSRSPSHASSPATASVWRQWTERARQARARRAHRRTRESNPRHYYEQPPGDARP